MAQKWIRVYYYAAALVLIFLCIESAGAQQSSVIPKSAFYELVNVLDIDIQAITATCNTLWANNAIITVEQSNISYGTLKEEIVIETSSMGNYSDCQEIYMAGYRTNGTYTVYLGNETKDVFCDLSNGGWTVFQKRFDGSVDFERSWTDYVNGFGELDGEFWLGLETVHQMTKYGCELLIHLKPRQGSLGQAAGFAKYTHFSIGDSSSGYTLNIGTFSGNVGDALAYHNGSKFSTFDMDNDGCSTNCAVYYDNSGWWYTCCWDSKLNGQYFAVENCFDGIIWEFPWDCEPLARTEMMFRC